MERIIQEKNSADHLLYVSLKYTKTTDVILNLIERWRSLMERCVDLLLEKAKKKKMIKKIPTAPKLKIDKVKEIFKKNNEIIKAIELLEFFKKIPQLKKIKENEFRKNLTLKVLKDNEWVKIDIEKLKKYNEVIENFIREVKFVCK